MEVPGEGEPLHHPGRLRRIRAEPAGRWRDVLRAHVGGHGLVLPLGQRLHPACASHLRRPGGSGGDQPRARDRGPHGDHRHRRHRRGLRERCRHLPVGLRPLARSVHRQHRRVAGLRAHRRRHRAERFTLSVRPHRARHLRRHLVQPNERHGHRLQRRRRARAGAAGRRSCQRPGPQQRRAGVVPERAEPAVAEPARTGTDRRRPARLVVAWPGRVAALQPGRHGRPGRRERRHRVGRDDLDESTPRRNRRHSAIDFVDKARGIDVLVPRMRLLVRTDIVQPEPEPVISDPLLLQPHKGRADAYPT